MLAFGSSSSQEHFAESIDFNTGIHDSHPGLSMNPYGAFGSNASFEPMPCSCYGNPALFVEAPHDDSYRSFPSNGNMKIPWQPTSELPPSTLSTASGPSVPSASSSTVGSPYSGHVHSFSCQDPWGPSNHGLGIGPVILNHDGYFRDSTGHELDPELPFTTDDKRSDDFVDPSLIQPPRPYFPEQHVPFAPQNMYAVVSPSYHAISPAQSPAQSPHEEPEQSYAVTQCSPHFPPPMMYDTFQQQPSYERQSSIVSYHPKHPQSPSFSGLEYDQEGKEKGKCPNPGCGRIFKDLKTHMLTHQSERPEKCPIFSCEYNQKGFARKYDKNRHTLTHYKGTMVCGFCPGCGSASEKSFNRADVFKRHLTSVHNVEQTPPNSRKRGPTSSNKKLSSYCQDATGKCSTCSATFNNAQDFYEHLDDCVLRVVQLEEPREAINQQRLAEVAADKDVQETMERHMLADVEQAVPVNAEKFEEDEEDDDGEEDGPSYNNRSGKGMIKSAKAVTGARAVIGANISKPGRNRRKGLTYAKGGVAVVGKSCNKRKNYPPAWGMSADKMKMKKRVLYVYDGQHRMWKDDMMLDNEFEVRVNLADGKSYVTDLDVETIKRANAILDGPYSPQERHSWEEEGSTFDLAALMS